MIRGIVALISIMFLLFTGFLLLLPFPVSFILASISFISILLFNINLFSSYLILTPDKLIRQSLFGSKELQISQIKKIDRMRVLGTVANAPFAIRNVEFSGDFDKEVFSTLIFPWKLVLDIIDIVNKQIIE